ncbi:unnamed protein product [Brassica oleracea var. botrytis]|uniref:Uncharacterized protein n=3 Tax=Brassica TaxID=3705 RepID=A0ABQ7DR88_BRACR|nr:uncharacterized protein LOC125585746 [Brassica napus]KAF3560121.1 hypothetical protein F2Q69_00010760 [Brassica cretica]KAF3580594.1 hypothetical protein DY000_02028791 [Brassica cretica]CAF1806523.1 unnamed protein product [Brassica napus]CDY18917.1 BnaC04g04330D [Brassica napus]
MDGGGDGGNVNQPPLNLQHQIVEDQGDSTHRWLQAWEMNHIMLNADLFQVINPTLIPVDEQGLYPVDNESMRDNNSWLHSSLPSNGIRFHIRLSIGYAIDFGDFVFAVYRKGDLHIPMY